MRISDSPRYVLGRKSPEAPGHRFIARIVGCRRRLVTVQAVQIDSTSAPKSGWNRSSLVRYLRRERETMNEKRETDFIPPKLPRFASDRSAIPFRLHNSTAIPSLDLRVARRRLCLRIAGQLCWSRDRFARSEIRRML